MGFLTLRGCVLGVLTAGLLAGPAAARKTRPGPQTPTQQIAKFARGTLNGPWTYIPIDDKRGKWGDFDKPQYVKYFGLAFADVDRDGFPDVVSGRYVYRNPGGDLTRPWARIDFGLNVDASLALDVDGDDRQDIVGFAAKTVYWLEAADARGDSWTATPIDSTAPAGGHANPQGYRVVDLIPGGKPELAFNNGAVTFYEIPENDPAKTPWRRTMVSPRSNEEGLGVGDIDRDGKIDLVFTYVEPGASRTGSNDIVWMKNPGQAGAAPWKSFSLGRFPGQQTDRVEIADLNGDHRLDIVVTEEAQPVEPRFTTYWYEAPPEPATGRWRAHKLVTGYTMNAMDAADLDGDGDVDITIGEHRGGKKLAIFENDGKGRFTERIVDRGKESHLGARAADLDRDGDPDIVSICWDDFRFVHLWRNDAKPGTGKTLRKAR